MGGNERAIDFTTFILSVSSAAFMGLGMAPRSGSEKKDIDLDLAKHNIDLLNLLKEKTANNLSLDEARLLDSLLYETRMRYVEIQKNSK